MNSKTYFWFNCIWAGIITLMLLYAGFFAYSSHAMACVYKSTTGEECATCGLTRAFHHLLIGEFSSAYRLNPLSVRLFLFFAIQLMLRLFFIFYPAGKYQLHRRVIYDILVAVLMFLVCFYPLIQKLIVT